MSKQSTQVVIAAPFHSTVIQEVSACGLIREAQPLEVRISFPESRWLFLIVEQLRRMFDLSADPHEIAAHLTAGPLLAKRIEAMPGLRVPGCWDGFELAVRAILGQQVSVAGASTLAGRLVRTFGTPITVTPPLTHLFPTAEVLAEADVACIGLPRKRAETIRALALAVSEGRIDFGSVANVEEFQSRLCDLAGIGNWTAQYVAMRALGDPDAFPASDLGLLRGASLPNERELAQRAESWRPWRAYAAMYKPQPCGFWNDPTRECRCTPLQILSLGWSHLGDRSGIGLTSTSTSRQ